jgi:hypothetical protein
MLCAILFSAILLCVILLSVVLYSGILFSVDVPNFIIQSIILQHLILICVIPLIAERHFGCCRYANFVALFLCLPSKNSETLLCYIQQISLHESHPTHLNVGARMSIVSKSDTNFSQFFIFFNYSLLRGGGICNASNDNLMIITLYRGEERENKIKNKIPGSTTKKFFF